MPRNQNTTKVRGFAGLTNTVSPEELTTADRDRFPLLEGENVYLTNTRRIKRRPGFTQAVAGNFHSLWSDERYSLAVRDDELVMIDDMLGVSVLRSGLRPRAPMSYASVHGKVYYMNEAGEAGVVINGADAPWGLPVLPAPRLTQTFGSLPGGTYRIAVTQRTSSGEESGVWDLATHTVSDGQGIDVEIPLVDTDATEVSVYCSMPNGEELYEAARLPASTPDVVVGTTRTFGDTLQTYDTMLPPLGQSVAYHKGRMYVVAGKYLYYSDALAPSRFKYTNFFGFNDEIRLVVPVNGGLYVSADATYFLQGSNPADMSQTQISDAVAVRHTVQYLEPGDILDITDDHAVWMTNRGFMLGSPTGQIQMMTEADYTFAVSDAGSLAKIKQDGVTTLVGTMKSPTDGDNDFGMSDRVSAEVIRNKVT